jgi:hypothetical protein
MDAIFRQMYRAQSRSGRTDACVEALVALQPALRERVQSGQLLTASAYRLDGQF